MRVIQEKDKIIKIIEMFYPHAKIYLFGSYARGDALHRSDIDIAIDNGEPVDLYTPERIKEMVAILPIPQKVDIVDFNSVSLEMRKNIIIDRIIWKN